MWRFFGLLVFARSEKKDGLSRVNWTQKSCAESSLVFLTLKPGDPAQLIVPKAWKK